MIVKKDVHSFVKPVEIDDSSSPTTVYINKNIRYKKEDKTELWIFDSYAYSIDEYLAILPYIQSYRELNEFKNNYKKLAEEVDILKNRIILLENKN